MTRSREALRRLGGPVCPVCDEVDVDGKVEVRWISTDGASWLNERGKGALNKQSLAPMCQKCFESMHNTLAAQQVAEAERRAKMVAQSMVAQSQADTDEARARWLRQGGNNVIPYEQACVAHQSDLDAAEEIAANWGIGNGLFGSRGE